MNKRYRLGEIEEAVAEMEELQNLSSVALRLVILLQLYWTSLQDLELLDRLFLNLIRQMTETESLFYALIRK